MTQRTANTKEEHSLIVKDDRGRREFLLTEQKYSLGRSANCDIIIKSQFVSRHHATLIRHQREDNSFYSVVHDSLGQ